MNELEKTTVESTEVEPTPAQVEAPQAEAVEAPPADAVQAGAVAVEEPIAAKAAQDTEAADSGDSFAEAFEKTLVRIRNGQVLSGPPPLYTIAEGEVCVNIGYTSEGFNPQE